MTTNSLPETVTIPTDKYLELVASDLELTALDAAGVDNWEGYGEVDWAAVRSDWAKAKAQLAAQ